MRRHGDGRTVLANVSTNQDAFHAKFGGIVPEIASRQHLALLSAAVADALERAELSLPMLDGIAVTAGPGLVGSLVIGVASAKALAYASGKPLYAVNHLHGHIFAPFLGRDVEPEYPLLALLVSGGHSQLVHVDGPTQMRIVARTRDDAAGEAFDKTARLLDLPFPGGPEIDRLARDGDARAIAADERGRLAMVVRREVVVPSACERDLRFERPARARLGHGRSFKRARSKPSRSRSSSTKAVAQ